MATECDTRTHQQISKSANLTLFHLFMSKCVILFCIHGIFDVCFDASEFYAQAIHI